jgi:hypothetical protein
MFRRPFGLKSLDEDRPDPSRFQKPNLSKEGVAQSVFLKINPRSVLGCRLPAFGSFLFLYFHYNATNPNKSSPFPCPHNQRPVHIDMTVKPKKGGPVMEQSFWATVILDFLIALGVVLGGAALGGIGAFVMDDYPMFKMLRLAEQLKIWAMVAAIGGTFDTIKNFEINIMGGDLGQAFQQIFFILSAFFGAHLGTVLIRCLVQGEW